MHSLHMEEKICWYFLEWNIFVLTTHIGKVLMKILVFRQTICIIIIIIIIIITIIIILLKSVSEFYFTKVAYSFIMRNCVHTVSWVHIRQLHDEKIKIWILVWA